jgi:hypothetical protein
MLRQGTDEFVRLWWPRTSGTWVTHHFSGGNATPLLPVAERHANGAISSIATIGIGRASRESLAAGTSSKAFIISDCDCDPVAKRIQKIVL